MRVRRAKRVGMQRVLPVELPTREIRARLRLTPAAIEALKHLGGWYRKDCVRVGLELLVRRWMDGEVVKERAKRA